MGQVSLLDKLDGSPNIIGKSRQVDNFDSDSLDEMWTFTDHVGTGSGAMNDAVDGGYTITSGANNNDMSSINFNDINHYSHNSSVMIAEIQAPDTSNLSQIGLTEQISSLLDTLAAYRQLTTDTFKTLYTSLNASFTLVDSSIAVDTAFTPVKLELKTSSVAMWLNGNLEAIGTTDLPDVALQPHVRVLAKANATKDVNTRYMEVYNT